jgi:hypothetical protein
VKRRRYPLEPLRDLRASELEERRIETAHRAIARSQAEQELEHATEKRARAEQAVDALEQAERIRLDRGLARAADLQRSDAWRAGTQAAVERLREQEASAAQTRRDAASQEELARRRLTRSDADLRAVQRHETAWQERRRAAEDLAEDEQAAEVHAARRGPLDRPPGGGRR